jgi:vancomycin resistance protein YoaR
MEPEPHSVAHASVAEARRATVVEGDTGHVTEHTSETTHPRRRQPSGRAGRRGSSRPSATASRGPLYAAIALGVVLVLAVAVDAFASAGRVHPGVSVGGVAVGGKMPTEVVAALKAALPAKATARPVRVAAGSKSWSVSAKEIDASFDYAALLGSAMAVGRSGGFWGSVGQRLGAWFGGKALPAPAIADKDKLDGVIGKIAAEVDVPAKDASLSVTKNGVTLNPSATGISLDRTRLRRELLSAFISEGAPTVAAKADTAQPKISDAAAKSAQAVVETMVSAPATVTYKAKHWTLSIAELAKMIKLQSVQSTSAAGSGWVLVPTIGAHEASKTIVPKVGVALGNAPKDARFVARGGSVTIMASKDGVGPDVEEFAASLTTVLKNPDRGRTVELRTKVTPPKLTTEAAREMGIHERIASFTTEYSSGVPERVNNIHVLGDALDGKLVAPSSSFSFNGAVGERTAAKGYKEANAIVKGKLVPQLGGGICQVATTMFNAVFMSGFPVIERENHSFYISHYPTGRDATVSWGGPDLRWKNPTTHWVLVAVSYTSDSITVSLYGTSPGYDVTYETGKFTNVVPFKTEKVSDPALQAGVQSVVDPGVDGKKVVVTRTVKKNGQVVRVDTFTSNYTPKAATTHVGTKSTGSKAATSTPSPKKP